MCPPPTFPCRAQRGPCPSYPCRDTPRWPAAPPPCQSCHPPHSRCSSCLKRVEEPVSLSTATRPWSTMSALTVDLEEDRTPDSKPDQTQSQSQTQFQTQSQFQSQTKPSPSPSPIPRPKEYVKLMNVPERPEILYNRSPSNWTLEQRIRQLSSNIPFSSSGRNSSTAVSAYWLTIV